MRIKKLISLITVAVMVITGVAVTPFALPAAGEAQAETPVYTLDAKLVEGQPGVYKATAAAGADLKSDTLGISSVSKQNLADKPTTESPAIIMGAASGFEKKTGPTEYEILKERVAPYSYFRYGIIDEQVKDADGNITTHKKLSGFDGSYYIIRLDLSELLKDVQNPDGKYLHVKQEDNKALMVAVGFEGTTYSNGMGNKTGSYSLANNLAALKDTTGTDQSTPYFDVILYSSGKLTAGADAGKADTPNGDVKLSFYVDGTEDYHPGLVALDPNNMPTFPYKCKPDGDAGEEVEYQTETDYNAALLTKYYEDAKASEGEKATSYLVKGSDLEIDVTIDESNGDTSTKPKFWSIVNAMAHQEFDDHVIKLICEVPVLEGLSIKGDSARNVILDVNSFDIQIANNTTQDKAGLTIDSGAHLTIKDGTNTSGAELAIGNNASMAIKKGGVLTIDESCTNEVEYDAGTVPEGETPPEIAIGEITVEEGGKLINRGVINIEGAEAKPIDPSQADPPVSTDIKRADMFVNYGGILDNYGCMSLKGDLYVLGTLNNYGKYNDTIVAYDPDKGSTAYHRGIQVTWKDVVNDPNRPVEPGALNVGIDAQGAVDNRAVINNKGDIVLVPGTFNLYGTFNNYGNLYLCTAEEAIIPVINPNDPLEVEKRVKLPKPKESVFNSSNGKVNGSGHIGKAKVALIHNGVLGDLTPIAPADPTAAGTKHVVSNNTVQVLTPATGNTMGTVAFIKAKNAKKVTVPATVTLYGKKFSVVQIDARAFKGKKIRTVTVGSNVKKIQANAFKGSKATKMIVKSKKLTKAKVKGSLKKSKIRTVQVKLGKKKVNRKYVKKYRKIFTKKNAGKKVRVK